MSGSEVCRVFLHINSPEHTLHWFDRWYPGLHSHLVTEAYNNSVSSHDSLAPHDPPFTEQSSE